MPPIESDDPSRTSLLDDQRRRWQSGERFLVEMYLQRYPYLREDPQFLLELIEQELNLRQDLGETFGVEEYLGRFPEVADACRRLFDARARLNTEQPTTPVEPPSAPVEPARDPTRRPKSASWPNIPGYEIEEFIDRGGQGDVYRARHLRLDRVVALKILRSGTGDDENLLARFQREAKLSARLDHPHIVRVYDCEEHDGRLYLSMELLEGGSLKEYVRPQDPLVPEQAAQLLITLASAIQYAHEQGIVHRDLKPGNVLYTREGTPKVTDFGLARRLQPDATELTKTRTILGTAHYMAPEQAAGQGKHATAATDVYGLGAILYAVLTGEPPFDGEDWLDILIQVRTIPVIPPRQKRATVPVRLEQICLKCLEKEPAKRYPTAAALADDLRRFLEGGAPVGAGDTGEFRIDAPSAGQLLQPHEASNTVSSAVITVDPSGDAISLRVAAQRYPKIPGYEILEEIGRGGMGVVYKARQLSLNRIVALKTILHAGFSGGQELARFRREAETVASLNHPNIVHVYDFAEFDGVPYFAMEHVEGGSLMMRLKVLPQPSLAAEVIEQVARTMGFVHERRILHRDIKPANILLASAEKWEPVGPKRQAELRGNGVVKITDFGLLRPPTGDELEIEGSIMGTPSYMSPEQASGRGKDVCPASDVWSMGATLYESLTGQPPFRKASVIDTIMAVINEDVLPLRQLRRDIPHVLEAICLKCLRKDPAKRYANGTELADDLRRFLEGRPTGAYPTFWGRLFSWGR
jgi:serine/threonine protein kinase